MILYFSGTGNSAAVASHLGRELSLPLFHLAGDVLLHPESVVLQPQGGQVIWVFPVYSWGVPPVVEKFIREIPETPALKSALHTMVCTCGDDMGLTDKQWRQLMESRGWRVAPAAFSVEMPNTYVLLPGFNTDSKALEQRKLDAMPARVAEIARAIRLGLPQRKDYIVRGAFPAFKSRVIRPFFVRHLMSPEPFHCTSACTGCGTCARSCPMENISMVPGEDGHPQPSWARNCALCLRCYHICPHHAVTYGKVTRGKGQYICPPSV